LSGFYDKLGQGQLLSEGERVLAAVAKDQGWVAKKTREIEDNLWRVGVFHVREASIYTLVGPGDRTYVHVPLCAKSYAIAPGSRSWYSVSRKVVDESRAFEAYIILTFIKELNEIRVSDARFAVLDTKTGNYSRYFEQYFGWYLDETVSLVDWMEDPSRLTGQTKLQV